MASRVTAGLKRLLTPYQREANVLRWRWKTTLRCNSSVDALRQTGTAGYNPRYEPDYDRRCSCHRCPPRRR